MLLEPGVDHLLDTEADDGAVLEQVEQVVGSLTHRKSSTGGLHSLDGHARHLSKHDGNQGQSGVGRVQVARVDVAEEPVGVLEGATFEQAPVAVLLDPVDVVRAALLALRRQQGLQRAPLASRHERAAEVERSLREIACAILKLGCGACADELGIAVQVGQCLLCGCCFDNIDHFRLLSTIRARRLLCGCVSCQNASPGVEWGACAGVEAYLKGLVGDRSRLVDGNWGWGEEEFVGSSDSCLDRAI